MIRRHLTLVLFCLLLSCGICSAWGRRNHAAAAYIAEQYLTPYAREMVGEILKGESMTVYASYPDDFPDKFSVLLERSEYMKLNGEPIAKGPDGMPFSYGTKFRTDSRGKVWSSVAHGWLATPEGKVVDVPKCECVWHIERCIKELKDYRNQSDSTRLADLLLLIHLIPDMHCPVHVHYTDGCDGNDGKYQVFYRDGQIRYHSFWDTNLLVDRFPGGMVDMAWYCDPLVNGMMPQDKALEQMEAIQSGSVHDWAAEVASRIVSIYDIKENDTLTPALVHDFSILGKDLILRSGYRLAKVLNDLFPDKAAMRKAQLGPQLTPSSTPPNLPVVTRNYE